MVFLLELEWEGLDMIQDGWDEIEGACFLLWTR